MEPPALVFWRTALASVFFFLFCRLKSPPLLTISRRHCFLSIAAGSLLGMHWLCFFGAVSISNVSIGLAGFAATCLFTALLEPLIHRRKPDTPQLLLAGLVAVGILLIAGAKTEVPNAAPGLLLAILGAFLAAAYSLLSKHLVEASVPGPTIMAYQIAAANVAVLLSILFLPSFHFETPVSQDWLPLLVLSIACTFIAYLWYARMLQHLSTYTVNLAMNFEPVYGILLAAFFFAEHESLTPLFYLGTFIILVANGLHSRQPQ